MKRLNTYKYSKKNKCSTPNFQAMKITLLFYFITLQTLYKYNSIPNENYDRTYIGTGNLARPSSM